MLSTAQDNSSNLAQVHQNQQLRLKVLDVIKALFDQLRVVQQHRAASNGALGGNPFFESKTRILAREVNARFGELQRKLDSVSPLFDGLRWKDIQNAWHTVHLQWRQDEAIENFELHSHLVRQKLDFIALMGDKAADLIETDVHQKALALYVIRDLPWFIELLGQIRGLGTHAAAVGFSNDACTLRLKFLVQQVQSQQLTVRDQAAKLSKDALSKTSALIDAQLCEPKLKKLITVIKQDLLSGNEIEMTADELFLLTTEIMDANYNVMNEGLRLHRLAMDLRIKAWVNK